MEYLSSAMALAAGPFTPRAEDGDEPLVRQVIGLVRDRTGTDFSGYRRSTILRRIRNRMICLGITSLDSYVRLLQRRPDEAPALIERLTIKVSRFYRNVRTFDFLRDEVLPVLARNRAGKPVRVWSAGCGRGEEAWTLALLLERARIAGHVQATDIDPCSLRDAERGVYGAEVLADLPADLAENHLEAQTGGRRMSYRVRDLPRRRVRFSLHDLTGPARFCADASFDLVCCRNVLIYLEPQAQLSALVALRAAVADNGYLCLGEAEWPLAPVSHSLRALGRKTHVFRACVAGTTP